MSFVVSLDPGETVRWQGRPAPRCYTFRNWRHSLFGLVLSLPSLFWWLVGRELAASGHPVWFAWLPLPLVLTSAWLVAGHLFWARLQWERIVYTITDQRLLLQGGVLRTTPCAIPLAAVREVRVKRLGRELATLQLDVGSGRPVRLCCLEHPEGAIALLRGPGGGDREII